MEGVEGVFNYFKKQNPKKYYAADRRAVPGRLTPKTDLKIGSGKNFGKLFFRFLWCRKIFNIWANVKRAMEVCLKIAPICPLICPTIVSKYFGVQLHTPIQENGLESKLEPILFLGVPDM